MSKQKQKDEQRKTFCVTRRNFLQGGASLATAAGLFALMNKNIAKASPTLVGPAASDIVLSKGTLPVATRPMPNNDEWLGTSKIVGPIKRTHEKDIGFYQAAVGKFGEEAKKGTANFARKHPMGRAICDMTNFIAMEEAVDGQPAEEKLPIPDPEQMSRHIKNLAFFLNADEVGIGVLPQYAVYTHQAPPMPQVLAGTADFSQSQPVDLSHHKYVIAVLVDQDLRTMLGSTGYDGVSASQSMQAYLFSGVIACTIAAYIRNLGYSARASHFSNYSLAMPPVLIAAGLGEMSRTGECVLHPRLGFRHKAACVTTDLPLMPDSPIDFGLREFCSHCMKCAEECPNGSISLERDQKEFNGYLKWVGDMKQCTIFRATNDEGSSCGRCMKVCPWNSKEDSWYHSASVYASSKSKMVSRLLRDMDDIFGYGTEIIEDYRWWLEFPELYR